MLPAEECTIGNLFRQWQADYQFCITIALKCVGEDCLRESPREAHYSYIYGHQLFRLPLQRPTNCHLGVCLSSAYLSRNGALTWQWLSTSAGVLIQIGEMRLDHGFPTSKEVFHPSPTGKRINQIV